jgi:hypothetical protein
VESLDDAILARLDKGHTRADFVEVARRFGEIGMALAPTFIPFTPWTTRDGFRDLLAVVAELDLVENVSSVQFALRLLVPRGSRLLELPDLTVERFDEKALIYRWRHVDPTMDELAARLLRMINDLQRERRTRAEIFERIWEAAYDRAMPSELDRLPRAAIPYMDEPWYC